MVMLQSMFQGLSKRELAAMPPFPFPQELFPANTFPEGVRFSREGLQGVPPAVEALLGAGEGAALGAMFSASVDHFQSSPRVHDPAFWLRDVDVGNDYDAGDVKRFLAEQSSSAEGQAQLVAMLQRLPGFADMSEADMSALVASMIDNDECESDSQASDASRHNATVFITENHKQARCEAQESASAPASDEQAAPVTRPASAAWFAAAKEGSIVKLQALLNGDGALLHGQSPGVGHTALHWAAAKGHCRAVRFLLQAGADVNARNACRSTPLHSAGAHGRSDAVRLLLAQPGCDVSAVNEDGFTAEQLAKQQGHTHLLPMHPRASSSEAECSREAQKCSDAVEQDIAPGLQRDLERTGTVQQPERNDSACTVQPPSQESAIRDGAVRRGAAQHEAHLQYDSLRDETLPWCKQIDWSVLVSRELGQQWMAAAKAGNVQCLQQLLQRQPALLVYRGKGTSYGFCGVLLPLVLQCR